VNPIRVHGGAVKLPRSAMDALRDWADANPGAAVRVHNDGRVALHRVGEDELEFKNVKAALAWCTHG
jgi:hypothetical protein